MFYFLVFAGVAFFSFGVTATMATTARVSREYEAMITQLVETEDSMRDLEVKYQKSQDEIKLFRLKIDSSKAWATDEINEAHLELEKLKSEYVSIKVRAGRDKGSSIQAVEEKCKKLLVEVEEYNKLLEEKNNELSGLKKSFQNIKSQLETNQKTLSDTHNQLKSLESFGETHEKIKGFMARLEGLKGDANTALPPPEGNQGGSSVINEADPNRKYIDTMKSFLHSLDNKTETIKDNTDDLGS